MKMRTACMMIISLFAVGVVTTQVHAADKVSAKDKQFMKKAALGGMLEVQLGQAAQNRAQSQDVKDFGMRMATDHGKANDELKQLAQQKDVSLPTQLEHKQKYMVDKISVLSGADFDKKYMKMMVKDHIKDVADFKSESQKVKDPDLKAWITKTLPVLEQHLQLAKDVAGKVGVDVNKADQKGHKKVEKKEKQ